MKRFLVLISLVAFAQPSFASDNSVAGEKYNAGDGYQVPWRTTDDGSGHQSLHVVVDSGGGGGGGDASAANQTAVQANPGSDATKATAVQGVTGGKPLSVKIDQTTAGSTNATQQKQYTGVPSTFTVGTADATVFTLAAGEIGFVQNLDDAALAVKKGASASTSSFNFILAAGTAADDGKGGAVRIDDWVGVVSVAALTGSPRFIAWKQAP